MDTPTCGCGCGEAIPSAHLFRYRPPYFLRGHRAPEEINRCDCGCDQVIPWRAHHRYQRPHTLGGHLSPTARAASASRRTVTEEPNPSGLCQCGCGHAAPIATMSSKRTGTMKGRPARYISGHNSYGVKRGPGRLLNAYGYVLVYAPTHPWAKPGMKGYVLEHRLVMEQTLGRGLARYEHVHHRNGNKLDNRLENLELVNIREHGLMHGRPKGWRMTAAERLAHSERMKRWWAERRAD